MLRSYLTLAARTLRKRLGTTVINVTGLAVGLAACLLLGLWLRGQLSYDAFHPDADRIYRVALDARITTNALRTASAPAPLLGVLRSDVPEVEAATQARRRRGVTLQREREAFGGHTVVRADSAFFRVFGGFRLLRGDRATALGAPDALVLSATTARRVFGGRLDVVGEALRMDGEARTVTGVMADVPHASHLQFDAVARRGPVPALMAGNWTGFAYRTYAKLRPGTPAEAFEAKLNAIAEGPARADVVARFEEVPEEQVRYDLFAEPLTHIHLYSGVSGHRSIGMVATMGVIGLFILLLACINFMNLATARAAERATEVGMRKALGAGRRQVAGQFLGEALLTTAVAAVLAFGAARVALPAFNALAGTSFGGAALAGPGVLAAAAALVLVVGGVAGSYPALVLSRFSPASVLKAAGRTTTGGGGRRLRQGLVVVQFAVSIALIAGTLVAREQMAYVQEKDLGIEKARVVEVQAAGDLGAGRQATLVERLRRTPGVEAAAAGDALFARTWGTSFVPVTGDSTYGEPLAPRYYQVGPGYPEALGIDVTHGRAFDPARPADSSAVLINHAAVNAYGWTPEAALGKRLASSDSSAFVFEVIGVVEDYHFRSMRERVEPLVLMLRHPHPGGDVPTSVFARLAPGATASGLAALRTAWRGLAREAAPFQYAFLDQTYDAVHRDVLRIGRVFSVFAGLAVFIACLGLFGLAAYTVQRRAKEIGVRKALGASAAQVVGLLARQFLVLVGVAAAVGLPVAYLGMQQWLEGFAYRTSPGAGTLAGAALLAALVALAALATHALRAARLDPAQVLRSE